LEEGVWDKNTTFATVTVTTIVSKQPRIHLVGESRDEEVVRRRFLDMIGVMVTRLFLFVPLPWNDQKYQ
jgi:hypothetical protein